jgi:iron complex outermembrane receptor protein
MRKSKLSLAILATLLSSQVYASTDLDSVTVTATRTEEAVSKQALSIAKKGAEETKLDQAVFQKDVLNSVAGVSVKQTGSVIGHTIAVRMPDSTSPYYLYLQDSVPVQSSGFFNHNAMAYTNFQTADSVEILKGAGTALYGSDSVAATINIQSVPPSLELERKINVYGGSDGFKQGGFSVSDTLADDSSYRLSGSITDNEGWRDHTNMQRQELSGQYNFTRGQDDFKVSFISNYSRAQQASYVTSLDDLENNAEVAGNESFLDNLDLIDAMRQFDHNRVSLQWDSYRVEGIDLSTIAYIRNTRNQYTATWENNLPFNDSQQNTFGLMHKGVMNPTWGRFIYGVDGEVTQGSTLYTQQFDYVPTGWGSSVDSGTIYDYDVNYLAVSPYLHSDIELTNALTLSAGLRYDINQYQYTNNTDDGQYATSSYSRPADRNDNYDHLSPKLALNYALSSNSMVYARYANAFRVPSASRLYSLSTSNIDFSLEPETSNTYELGYKVDGQSTDVEVALYYMDLADTITRSDDRTYYYNGGTTIHKGLELSLKHDFNPQWSTKVAYSYSVHNFENDAVYNDNEIAKAPNHLLNLRAFYRPAAVNGLLVMAEGIYTSEYWMDNAHEASYAGYKILNLKADYQVNKAWRVFAKLDNVTDEPYAESASYDYGSERYTPGAPRQFFVGAELTW